jgi:hypothetical protein
MEVAMLSVTNSRFTKFLLAMLVLGTIIALTAAGPAKAEGGNPPMPKPDDSVQSVIVGDPPLLEPANPEGAEWNAALQLMYTMACSIP